MELFVGTFVPLLGLGPQVCIPLGPEFLEPVIELLEEDGLINGIKGLGIDDLTEKDERYLLRVLTKPELDGAIVLDELL